MASDTQKVVESLQCWRHNKSYNKGVPMRSLSRGWPSEVVAMDLFGSLPKTKASNVFVLALIDHFPR